MDTLKQPTSVQYAIVLIIIAMIIELIGLSMNAVRGVYGSFGVLIAHGFMSVTAFTTFKYLVDIEKRKIHSRLGLILSIALNMFFLFVVIRSGHANPFLIAALMIDAMGTICILSPTALQWLKGIQNQESI